MFLRFFGVIEKNMELSHIYFAEQETRKALGGAVANNQELILKLNQKYTFLTNLNHSEENNNQI